MTVSGTATSDCVLVLRVGKTKRTKQVDWTWELDGAFSAELTSTDKLYLGDGAFGKGIVIKVYRAHKASRTRNIAMSEGGQIPDRLALPDGLVRFRAPTSDDKSIPAIEQEGDAITIADVVCGDGTVIPLTVLVRERNPNPSSRLNW